MATVKKVIGRIPVGRGAYNDSDTYYKENTVTMYGMSFRSLVDNINNVPPAILEDDTIVLANEDSWQLTAGDPSIFYKVVQETGNSESKVMSQKAATDAFSPIVLTQEDYDYRLEHGEIDNNKTYYITEE